MQNKDSGIVDSDGNLRFLAYWHDAGVFSYVKETSKSSYLSEVNVLVEIRKRAAAMALDLSLTAGLTRRVIFVGDSDSMIRRVTSDKGVNLGSDSGAYSQLLLLSQT